MRPKSLKLNFKSTSSPSAFTLVEVVLAMMIMASGLMILTNSWSGTYGRLKKTNIQVQMASLLERKIVEIEKEFKGKPLDSIPEEKSDDFGSELAGYSWSMKSQNLEFPDISPLISNGEDQNMDLTSIFKIFGEHLSKTVKEVEITISYKKEKKPITASVVIYFIDYDKQLPIPGASGG